MGSLNYKDTVKYLVLCSIFFLGSCSAPQRGGQAISDVLEGKLKE